MQKTFGSSYRRSRRQKFTSRRQLIEGLEIRRLLHGDTNWTAYEGGGVTMDHTGAMVDLSVSPAPAPAAGHGSGDYVLGPSWGTNSVTFGFSNLLDGGLPLAAGTSTSDLRQLVYDALGLWTAVSGLVLTYANDPGGAVNDNTYNGAGYPQIRIGHHDIPEPGGGLNVLAHCYYPGGNGRDGDMHFDDSDTWGNGSGGGINFLETAAHELGHGIGIAHANGDAVGSCPAPKPAIMDACIQGRFTTRDSAYLFADDISAAQAQYGVGLGYLRGQDGIARVYGTGVASNVAGTNVITVSTTNIFLLGDCYVVNSSGYGQTIIPTNTINGLIIEGMGGNDILRVDSNFAGKPITLRGGNGDDYFDFGYNTGALGGMPQGVTVEGGAGTDYIWTYDDNTAAAQTYTITNARFDRGGWGGFFYDVDLESLYLRTGTGADVVNVQSTFSGQPVVVASAGGADAVNIGNGSNGIRSINADVQIQNDPNWTDVSINNGPDTGARAWAVDISGSFGYLTGMAPANIFWDNTDINAINLTCGSGADTGSINRLSETLNINNSGGGNTDQITVGNASASGLANITQGRAGGLTIDNNPSFTRIILDDNGNATARNATLNFDSVSSYNVLSGLAPATIRFDDTDIENVTIQTGSGDDILSVTRYADAIGSLTINSSGGTDTVNLGNTTDGVRSITAGITVRNTPAFTTLNINDTGDATARSVTIDYNSGTDLQSVVGLAAATIAYDPGDITTGGGVVITSGGGNDAFTVMANYRTLSLGSSGGTGESVYIGNDLSRIVADIYLRNPPSFTSVTVSDNAAVAPRNFLLTTATIGAETFNAIALAGLFSTSIYLKTADMRSPVTLLGGAGDDTITLQADYLGYSIIGNNGNDLMNYGGNLVGLRKTDQIFGVSSFDGGPGLNTVSVNDQDYAAGTGVITVNPTSIGNNHGGPLSFFNTGAVNVSLSNQGETLNVTNTAASFNVLAVGGALKDFINVAQTAVGSYVKLLNSTGFDDVNVDSTASAPLATLYLSGSTLDLGALQVNNAGRVTLIDSNASVRVRSLAFAGGGRFDLANGSMVVNYTGATVAPTVRSALLTGRNGGTWNGAGLYSSTIGGTPGYALGYGEASVLRTTFPATFANFADVDNTSILVRYTLIGDTNLDKAVNFDDLLKLAQNYNPAGSGKVWTDGDFDYTGVVSFDDLLALAQKYGQSFSVDWALATARPSITSSLRSRNPLPVEDVL